MIEISNLTRKYGEKTAVENVSFKINKGEIVGLLGPNGAGKTTIMKMIAGYLMPTNGTILVDGIDVVENPREAAAKIGFLPELPPLYLEMEVAEYLKFMAEIKGIAKEERASRIEEVMDIAQVAHVKERVIAHLSKGYRQRVGLAGALMGMPEILILDEPTVGLDPRQIADFRKLMIELGKNHTIIFSTHILSEIDMVCEKVVILNEGRVVAVDQMEKLEQGKNGFLLLVDAEQAEAKRVLAGVMDESCFAPAEGAGQGSWFHISEQDSPALRKRIFFALAQENMAILEMKNMQLTLEQVFLNLTAVDARKGKEAQ
ncbi:MAG: ABC transporter ATP-binding protein [Christensenella sp.]|uniref:ABC transporter ATP-binding protein n=1 Tax=Christensenella sp. TaxID=1935934 RepID=UPI002B1F04E6|nr:ABC transporter ATP-binding protein [Christensenella sp.]MEA5003509.1 ABC transporter ATP-binding protein [Christensenella sp.]